MIKLWAETVVFWDDVAKYGNIPLLSSFNWMTSFVFCSRLIRGAGEKLATADGQHCQHRSSQLASSCGNE